jgi:RTA1 like protein
MRTGGNVVLGDLILQVVVFAFFIFIAMRLHLRLNQHPTIISHNLDAGWARYMYALYAASAAILVRNIVRTVSNMPQD